MAVGESAGSVYVTIDGDVAPLVAKYAQAEAMSKAAGDGVASGFNTAAAGTEPFTVAINRVLGVLRDEGEATRIAIAGTESLGGSFRRVGKAAKGSVSEIQAVGGAVRVLSGEQGIRVVERFITSLGAGGLATAVYPLLGLAATAELVFRAFGKLTGQSEELKAAEKELADQTDKTSEAFRRTSEVIDESLTSQAGKFLGPVEAAEFKVESIRNKIRELYDDIAKIQNVDIKGTQRAAAGHPFEQEEAQKKILAFQEQIKQKREQIEQEAVKLNEAMQDSDRAVVQQSGSLQADRRQRCGGGGEGRSRSHTQSRAESHQ